MLIWYANPLGMTLPLDTTIRGVSIHLDHASLAQIVALPDERNSVTLGSTTRDIPNDIEWSFEAACDRLWIRHKLNIGKGRNNINPKDLSP